VQAVSLREVRLLLDVAGALEYDPRRGFAPAGLGALCELLEADWLTYFERPRAAGSRFTVVTHVGPLRYAGRSDALEAIFWAYQHEFVLGNALAPKDGVVLIGDVATRAWRRTAFYNEWCREVLHAEPQAKVCLSATGAPCDRGLIVDLADHAGCSFGHRERTLLELIRPAFLKPIALAEATRERHRELGLTRRELEVLGLVREGLTNGEIARKLFVSPGTIRSHLEHAFAKLGAHTRTEAISRVAEIGHSRSASSTLSFRADHTPQADRGG
jgi:DNA-binding CsgD family transcriptional regulator